MADNSQPVAYLSNLQHMAGARPGTPAPQAQGDGAVRASIDENGDLEADTDALGEHAAHQLMVSQAAPLQRKEDSAQGSGVVQRARADVFRGGAELEYRQGKMELEFGNIPDLEGTNLAAMKDMIRKGVKGIDVASLTSGEAPTNFGEADWSLTVETNVGSKLDADNKLPVEMELILGGPTGSPLSQLGGDEGAAARAATKIAALDENGVLAFDGAGNKIRDAYKSKIVKQGAAQQRLGDEDAADVPGYLNVSWNDMTVRGTWDADGTTPSNVGWGLQTTVGVPLSELSKVGASLADSGLTDTSEPKLPGGEEKITTDELLKAWNDVSNFTAPADPAEEQVRLRGRIMSGVREEFGAETEFDFENMEHARIMNDVIDAAEREKAAGIYQAIGVALGDNSDRRPSRGALDGLSMVIAAYLRGKNNGRDQGPKHQMQMVNKNPLNVIVNQVAEPMGGDYQRSLRRAVSAVIKSHASDTDMYRWVGKDLSVYAFANALAADDKDLVSENDIAYRSGQIGGLGDTMNPLGEMEGAEFDTAPIVELRDLGEKKPSEMQAVLDNLIERLNRVD